METSCRIYDDVINILDYIFYTYLYLSLTHKSISNLLSGGYLIFFYNVPHAFGLFLMSQSIVQPQAVTTIFSFFSLPLVVTVFVSSVM